MQPLIKLGNVDRAILLLDLFPEELPGLYAFYKETADAILSIPAGAKKDSINLLHTSQYWYNLVRQAQMKFVKYGNRLETNGRQFAEHIYEEQCFVFAFYCLQQYVAGGKCINKHFTRAAELLFFFR